MRGRPAVTRDRVLTYWRKHGPCTIMQIVRATGAERSHIKRMLRGKDQGMDAQTVERFWNKVDKRGSGPNGHCWAWTGYVGVSGYPRFVVRGTSMQASHAALTLDGKPRPSKEMFALHACDNKLCVNPAHLRWGTDTENHEDHRQRGRRGAHWLPDDTVHEIHRSPETNKDIAIRLGLTPSAICNIRKGRAHRRIYEQYCPMP
jgi:hypothetical protein